MRRSLLVSRKNTARSVRISRGQRGVPIKTASRFTPASYPAAADPVHLNRFRFEVFYGVLFLFVVEMMADLRKIGLGCRAFLLPSRSLLPLYFRRSHIHCRGCDTLIINPSPMLISVYS